MASLDSIIKITISLTNIEIIHLITIKIIISITAKCQNGSFIIIIKTIFREINFKMASELLKNFQILRNLA